MRMCRGIAMNTYDLLIVAKLEVVLHNHLVVPAHGDGALCVSLARTNDGEGGMRGGERTQKDRKRHTHFLISYLSSWPFFTLAKSQATTYCPVEVTIAFSSLPSPWLNLCDTRSSQ